MPRPATNALRWLPDGGQAGALIRQIDWAATPLGDPEGWPDALKTTLGIVLGSRHPMFVWWGPELIQFYNDAYLPSFGDPSTGRHPKAMGQRGRECWEEIWPLIGPQIDDVMARGIASWNEEQLVPTHRNGRLEDVYWTYGYSPIHQADGSIGGTLVICQETTRAVVARKALEVALEEGRRRSEFEQHLVGIVSHDLRNPLNAILLGTQTLAMLDELGPRSAKVALRMQSAAERGTRMIRDLLDFTQARLGGGLPINRTAIDVHVVTSSVLDEVRAAHPERELVLAHDGDGTGEWDGDRVAQAIANLISNAIHYGDPEHPVQVTSSGEAEHVRIAVHNRGPSIPEHVHATLFEPLERGANELVGTRRSIGLGLYIVREIATRHEGTIEVRSSDDDGTTFTLRLPRSRPAQK